jgi:hypothetical protein
MHARSQLVLVSALWVAPRADCARETSSHARYLFPRSKSLGQPINHRSTPATPPYAPSEPLHTHTHTVVRLPPLCQSNGHTYGFGAADLGQRGGHQQCLSKHATPLQAMPCSEPKSCYHANWCCSCTKTCQMLQYADALPLQRPARAQVHTDGGGVGLHTPTHTHSRGCGDKLQQAIAFPAASGAPPTGAVST